MIEEVDPDVSTPCSWCHEDVRHSDPEAVLWRNRDMSGWDESRPGGVLVGMAWHYWCYQEELGR